MRNEKVSPSLEDYLETILLLNEQNGDVRVTDIALHMSISKPSVNKAINILKTQGFVNHEHYGPLSLTEKGEAIAKSVAARHKIIKHFLLHVLGVDEDTAEKEACGIEHSMSSDTVQKLSDFVEKVGHLA